MSIGSDSAIADQENGIRFYLNNCRAVSTALVHKKMIQVRNKSGA